MIYFSFIMKHPIYFICYLIYILYFCDMKPTKSSILSALIKGLFRGKRKQAVAMETYLSCSQTIQKLIDTHKLGINLKERHVVLDASLHLAFMPQGTSSYAIKQSDKRYAAFFDKIVAYMNMQLGKMQKKDYVDPIKDIITFHVTTEHHRYVDDEGNLLPAHLQVAFDTILVGTYKNGMIDYKSVDNRN